MVWWVCHRLTRASATFDSCCVSAYCQLGDQAAFQPLLQPAGSIHIAVVLTGAVL